MQHWKVCAVVACVAMMAGVNADEVRLKPDTTPDVRLKPDTTDGTENVRLTPDTTDGTTDGTENVRLKPDTTDDTTDGTENVRLKPDTTGGTTGGTENVRLKPDAAYGAAAAQALPVLGPLDADGRVSYFIADGTIGSEYRPSDRELAIWALQAWERRANGALRFEPSPERDALVRVHWVPASAGQYGEMRSVLVNGRRGAEVYVRPDTEALGPDIARLAREDPLLRDTIVYLTCLHELGHALGLSHTAEYRDIMYFFGFGGDIPGFFTRYRNQLRSRSDIVTVSGLSEADVATLRQLYRVR